MNKNVITVFTAVLCMLYREVKLECSPSIDLPQEIQGCPTSEKELQEAAKRLKCKDKCGEMEYHCLPDTNMEDFVEFCAERVNIIGKRCAEYNKEGMVIQANRYNPLADCDTYTNPCPHVYFSSDMYKYPQCYNRSSKFNSVEEVDKYGMNTTLTNSTMNRQQSFMVKDILIFILSAGMVWCICAIILLAGVLLMDYISRKRILRKEKNEAETTPLKQEKHQETTV
ncbi:uncharacterized protein LOC134249504 [Saccostrea cucullata]|uniref:uncharacterized protein LOC134249504 n=1 Tax=Saccostrea cuccullata TaxID=36930 RepID=UPI002ED005DC